MKKWISPAIFSLAAVIVSLSVYADLPDSMAIHFGASGEPDHYVGKPVGAFLAPLLIVAVSLMTILSARLERDENKRRRAESVNTLILAIIGGLLLGVHLFTVSYNLGYEISPVKFASVAVGIVFVLVGNLVPRLSQAQSSMNWPKLPQKVQREYARFQGRLMFGAGFVFILLALLPDSIMALAFFGLLVLFLAVTFGAMAKAMNKT